MSEKEYQVWADKFIKNWRVSDEYYMHLAMQIQERKKRLR